MQITLSAINNRCSIAEKPMRVTCTNLSHHHLRIWARKRMQLSLRLSSNSDHRDFRLPAKRAGVMVLMEKAREFLTMTEEESETVSRLRVPAYRAGIDPSYYEGFCLRGIRVDRAEPGFVACSFKVPPRLTDGCGNLSAGAIANLVDEVGGAAIHAGGLPAKVSLEMSISYLSTAAVNDELEIISRVLGHKGSYSGTSVVLRNKATGELIAEGRHSLFGKLSSKI